MYCSVCGGSYPVEELARSGTSYVCANCKPGYLQARPTMLAGASYGGFWIRALALVIDGLIVGAVTVPVLALTAFSLGGFTSSQPDQLLTGLFGLFYLFLLAIALAYHVWFVHEKGGTPGKLALGLRIVTIEGNNLSIAQAIGRYFAAMLSGFTFYIGYIIAAFDSEKRALHDHICATRVIRR